MASRYLYNVINLPKYLTMFLTCFLARSLNDIFRNYLQNQKRTYISIHKAKKSPTVLLHQS